MCGVYISEGIYHKWNRRLTPPKSANLLHNIATFSLWSQRCQSIRESILNLRSCDRSTKQGHTVEPVRGPQGAMFSSKAGSQKWVDNWLTCFSDNVTLHVFNPKPRLFHAKKLLTVKNSSADFKVWMLSTDGCFHLANRNAWPFGALTFRMASWMCPLRTASCITESRVGKSRPGKLLVLSGVLASCSSLFVTIWILLSHLLGSLYMYCSL